MAEETAKAGRPLKFKSAKELQQKIDDYFKSCFEEWWEQDKNGGWHQRLDQYGQPLMIQKRPFTISGLAVHLGTSRQTLVNYEENEEYFDTIKRAKSRIENYTEEQLYNAEARNMTGIIFNLKNNYGWQDKTEVDNNIANKDGKPFATSLSQLSIEELRNLAKSNNRTT